MQSMFACKKVLNIFLVSIFKNLFNKILFDLTLMPHRINPWQFQESRNAGSCQYPMMLKAR